MAHQDSQLVAELKSLRDRSRSSAKHTVEVRAATIDRFLSAAEAYDTVLGADPETEGQLVLTEQARKVLEADIVWRVEKKIQERESHRLARKTFTNAGFGVVATVVVSAVLWMFTNAGQQRIEAVEREFAQLDGEFKQLSGPGVESAVLGVLGQANFREQLKEETTVIVDDIIGDRFSDALALERIYLQLSVRVLGLKLGDRFSAEDRNTVLELFEELVVEDASDIRALPEFGTLLGDTLNAFYAAGQNRAIDQIFDTPEYQSILLRSNALSSTLLEHYSESISGSLIDLARESEEVRRFELLAERLMSDAPGTALSVELLVEFRLGDRPDRIDAAWTRLHGLALAGGERADQAINGAVVLLGSTEPDMLAIQETPEVTKRVTIASALLDSHGAQLGLVLGELDPSQLQELRSMLAEAARNAILRKAQAIGGFDWVELQKELAQIVQRLNIRIDEAIESAQAGSTAS